MNLEIAGRLTRLRKENGYSQEELAAKLGVSRQAVSKWERAESCPDTDNLISLARLYGVSLDQLLLSGEEPKESGAIPANSEEDPERESGNFKLQEPVSFFPGKADFLPGEEDAGNIISPGSASIGEAVKNPSKEAVPQEPTGTGERVFFPKPEFSEFKLPLDEDNKDEKKKEEAEAEVKAKAGEEEEESVYEDSDGSRIITRRRGEETVVTAVDPEGRSVTVIEKNGKKSLHFDGLDPSDPATESLLRKFQITGTAGAETPAVKQKKSDGRPKKNLAWLYSSYPIVCLLVFLLLGFLAHMWHPGWAVFLTIPIFYSFTDSLRKGKGFKKALKSAWPVCCALIFVLLGSFFGLWHPGWIVFLTIPIIECL